MTTATISTGPTSPARSALSHGTAARAGSDSAAGSVGARHEHAAQQAVDSNSTHLRFHVGEAAVDVCLPPLDKLAFYVGLGGAAAFGLMEWPIAVLTAAGHLLSDDRRNRTVRALGEALDAAA